MDLIEILESGKRDQTSIFIDTGESIRQFNDALMRVRTAMYYMPTVMNPKDAVKIGNYYA